MRTCEVVEPALANNVEADISHGQKPHHAGLTADMFVLRGDRILTLVRRGLGEGFSHLPGGTVERGEDPLDAAVRETNEETGLAVRDARILRVWAWPTVDGWETVHATFVGWSDDGEVEISDEHSGFEWTAIEDYVGQWCSEAVQAAVPDYAVFLRNVRHNCSLVAEMLRAASK